MDKIERVYCLHRVLSRRKTPIFMSELCDLFEGCSELAVKRTMRFLKHILCAPIYCADGISCSYDKHFAFGLQKERVLQ